MHLLHCVEKRWTFPPYLRATWSWYRENSPLCLFICWLLFVSAARGEREELTLLILHCDCHTTMDQSLSSGSSKDMLVTVFLITPSLLLQDFKSYWTFKCARTKPKWHIWHFINITGLESIAGVKIIVLLIPQQRHRHPPAHCWVKCRNIVVVTGNHHTITASSQ